MLSSGLILLSCQSTIYNDSFDSPQSKIPPASIIELHLSLSFTVGFSRSFIQFGQPVSLNNIDEREPYCQFIRYEPPAALETQRTVQPDDFIITHSTQTIENSLSGFSMKISIGSKGLGDRDDQTLSSILKLRSEKQAEIVKLKCSIFAQPDEWNYLSVNQIKGVLGHLATIKFPVE